MTDPSPRPGYLYDDEISLADLILKARAVGRTVQGERRLMLRFLGAFGAVGLLLALGSGAEYSATTRILPYRSGGTGGNLSGLAGLAGIRLPAGAGDITITADLYPEVAKSQDFRIAVAETPLTFSSLNQQASTVAYFRDLRSPPLTELLASYTIGLPGKLLNAVRPAPTARSLPLGAGDSTPPLASYDLEYLAYVRMLEKRLVITSDKKTSVITITGKMPDPYAAADLVRVTSNRLMERIIEYESRKAGEQFRFVNEQFTQAKARYERAQRALAAFTDRNRMLMSATSQIDRDRLQREYELAFEVYQQFSRELEQARIKMNQDTPVFTVLEQVTVPTERASPKRGLVMLASLLLGAMAGVGFIALRLLMTSVNAQQGQQRARGQGSAPPHAL